MNLNQKMLDEILRRLTNLENEVAEFKMICKSLKQDSTSPLSSTFETTPRLKRMEFYGQRVNDMFTNGNRVLTGPFHVRCMNNHIYVDIKEFKNTDLTLLKENHRVHVFFSAPAGIAVEQFILFARRCHKITGRKAVVHFAPRTSDDFINVMNSFCKDAEGSYTTDLPKREILFKYDYNKYLQVWYSPITQICSATDVWDHGRF